MTIIAVVGPTAVGKSAAAVNLAHSLGGAGSSEIVGADAMQLYRDMDIGTAKVTDEEKRGITHHQIDVLDISQEASVAAYQNHAREDIDGIVAASKTPILVGGSGLYVSAALDKIDFPGTVPEVRERLEAKFAEVGGAAMHAELARVDPASAKVIDARNERRVVRALEVNEVTGRSFQPVFPRHTSHYDSTMVIGLTLDQKILDERIAQRTATMFELGLLEGNEGVEEVRARRRANCPDRHRLSGGAGGARWGNDGGGSDRIGIGRDPQARQEATDLVPPRSPDHLG